MKHLLRTVLVVACVVVCVGAALWLRLHVLSRGGSPQTIGDGLWSVSPQTGVDARTFGAAFDGVSDDTAAIQRAIDAVALLGGGDVQLPAGVATVRGLRLRRGARLVGAGVAKTRLVRRADAAGVPLVSGLAADLGVYSATLDGSGLRGEIVLLQETVGAELRDVVLCNSDDAGLQAVAQGAGALTLIDVETRNCGQPGYAQDHDRSFDGIYANGLDSVVLSRVRVDSCERDGVIVMGTRDVRITDSRATRCGRFGFVVDYDPVSGRGCGMARIERSRAELCGSGGFSLETKLGSTVAVRLERLVSASCGYDQWGYGGGIVVGTGARGTVRDCLVSRQSMPVAYGRAAVESDRVTGVSYAERFQPGDPVRGVALAADSVVVDSDPMAHTVSCSPSLLRSARRFALYSTSVRGGRSAMLVVRPSGPVYVYRLRVRGAGEYGVAVLNAKARVTLTCCSFTGCYRSVGVEASSAVRKSRCTSGASHAM